MCCLIYSLRYVLMRAYVVVNIQFTLRVREPIMWLIYSLTYVLKSPMWWLLYSLRYVLKRAYDVVNIQFTLRVKESLCGG